MASIIERNGSFRITVSKGFDIFGKRLRETFTYTPDPSLTPKKQRRAAEEYARQLEAKIQNGAATEGHKITLKEFSERWFSEYAESQLHPGTVEKYSREMETKILPVLGHLKLTELRPMNLNGFLSSLTKDGARKDGKQGGYSKASIAKTRNVLSSILRTATEWGLIDENPLEKVHPKIEAAADTVKYFTPEQAAAFLEYLEKPYTVKIHGHKRTDDTGKPYTVPDYESKKEVPEQLKVLFNLALFGGLRKGELLALEWSDFDFKNDTVQISKAVTMVGSEQVTKAPKTKTSHRTVSLPHFLMQRIHRMKLDRALYRLGLGDYWQGGQWLFIQSNGKQMNYSTPYQAFHEIIVRYNADKGPGNRLPLIPLHGLRHTSATLLIASNQDIRTVSSRLGHAQASTTMNIYAHALQESDRKAVNALEEMLVKQA